MIWSRSVKIVVQVKLMPDATQAPALERTLHAVNEAANWVSAVAFDRGVPREYELRKHTYAELKKRGLGAQAAQHTIKKVCDAYTTLKANIRAGNLGEPQPSGARRLRAHRSGSARTRRTPLMTGVCPGSTTRRRSPSGPPEDGSKTLRLPARQVR